MVASARRPRRAIVRHSTLTGADLHYPLGHSTAGTLTLVDNTASAILWENSGGADYLKIDTTNSSEAITLGNASENPFYSFLGSGDLRLGSQIRFTERASDPSNVADTCFVYAKDSAGTTHLYARDSAGTVHALTPPASTSGLTGTTNLSWSINSDAAAASDENPILYLLGGDGVAAPNDDIVRSSLVQESSDELTYFYVERNRNSGGYARIAPVFQIGLAGSTTNLGATLRLAGGTGSAAISEDITLTSSSGNAVLQFNGQISAPGAGSSSERFGIAAVAAGTNGTAIGRNASAGGSNGTAVGQSADAGVTGATAIGSAASAQGDNSIAIGVSASVTGAADEGIVIGRSSSTSAVAIILANSYSNSTANVCVLGSPTTPVNTLIFGEGDTDATPPNVTWRITNAAASNQAGGSLTIDGSRSRGSGDSGAVVIRTGNSGAASGTLNSITERMRFFQNSPNVGIGDFSVTSASAQVHVLANDSTSSTLILDQDGAGDPSIRFDASSESWIVGVDNSASDIFAVSESTSHGSGVGVDRFWITPNAGAWHFRSHTSGAAGEDLQGETVRVAIPNTDPKTTSTLWSYTLSERQVINIWASIQCEEDTTPRKSGGWYLIGQARRLAGASASLTGGTGTNPATIFSIVEDTDYSATIDVNSNDVRIRVAGNQSATETTHFIGQVYYQVNLV